MRIKAMGMNTVEVRNWFSVALQRFQLESIGQMHAHPECPAFNVVQQAGNLI